MSTSPLSLNCVAGGVNPLYNCVSWSGRTESATAAFYACGRSIIVNDTAHLKNHLTLSRHTDRVNFVKAINNFTHRQLLVSGGSDNQLVIWETLANESVFEKSSWSVKAQIDLTHSVSFASVCEFAENLAYLVVGNIMGDVYLFKLTDAIHTADVATTAALTLIDNIRFGHHFTQECAEVFKVTDTDIAVFLGGLDFKVHVYIVDTSKIVTGVQREKGSLLEYKTSLKGHENAITDLQVHTSDINAHGKREWIVASSSKDSYIRLWRFAELLESSETDKSTAVKQISEFQSKQTMRLTIRETNYFISLESVLSGHSESVVSLQWGQQAGEVALLSASFDFNIILWTKDKDTGIWLSSYRLGQVCGSKFAFFHAAFNLDFTQILSYTYTGSFYFWHYNATKAMWESKPTVTGHFNQVFDLDWSSKGDFLVSCGLDQTTRMYAQSAISSNWHEVSRAQIHGYDINSVKCLPVNLTGKNVCDTLLCGADEKVVRLFEPPAAFVNAVNQIGNSDLRLFFERDEDENKYMEVNDNGVKEYQVSREGGAQVLGLMIKAVKTDPEFDPSKYVDPEDEGGLLSDKMQLLEDKKKEEELFSQKHDFRVAPIEDYLLKHTLWPELNKLYGHGYELKCVGCSNDGQIIVSCSKSQTKENAGVLFWNPKNYQIIGRLEFHNFTINQLEFSPSDTYFATVSKDRSLALYARATSPDATAPYEVIYSDKSHTRIVHSLSFSSDEKYLVTGARDKRIKIHALGSSTTDEKKVILTKLLATPVTAIAFSPVVKGDANNVYSLVVGYEDGKLEVYEFDATANTLNLIGEPHIFEAHTDTITRIRFRPQRKSSPLQFASCSLDHTLRVFNLTA